MTYELAEVQSGTGVMEGSEGKNEMTMISLSLKREDWDEAVGDPVKSEELVSWINAQIESA